MKFKTENDKIVLNKKRKYCLLIFIFLLSTFLIGCDNEAPECNADETKALVIKIAKEKLDKSIGVMVQTGLISKADYEKTSFVVKNIRTKNLNKDTGTYSCAADFDIVSDIPNLGGRTVPITYTSELLEGGENFYVTVQGF
jgi:hypothetical protein